MDFEIRPFKTEDAPKLAEIIQDNFSEAEELDSLKEKIRSAGDVYTPRRICEIAGQALLYTACRESGAIGFGMVSGLTGGGVCLSVFVGKRARACGAGRQIMEYLTGLEAVQNARYVETARSSEFYKRWAA